MVVHVRYGVAMVMLVVGTMGDSCHVIQWTWYRDGCHWWSTSGMVVKVGVVLDSAFIEC